MQIKHSQWLASDMIIEIKVPATKCHKPGRKILSYINAGPRLKRKLASDLASKQHFSMPLFLHPASLSAKKRKQKDLADFLKKAMNF